MLLWFPFLDFLDVFLVGNVFDGRDEAAGVCLLLNLAAKRRGQRVKASGRNLREIALAEFTFDGGQLFSKDGCAVLAWAEQTILEVVQFDSALVLDFETELAAPFDEGALGDAEFGGDANQTPALGAAFDEFLTYFWRMHAPTIANFLESLNPERNAERQFAQDRE